MAVTLKGQTAVYEGTSTDTKPTDADNNAIFKELDTGIRYYYDGTDWNEIPSSGGGGGGTGTDNYNELNNKPSINGTVLSGNKSLDNLGIQAKLTFDSAPTEDSENPVESGGVYSALAGKQDTLSSEQLDAVNSGITSADVEQITTNKNNILFTATIGECESTGNTANKVVTVSDVNYTPHKGSIIAVKFKYSNNVADTAERPITLNVNNTGAYRIWYKNGDYVNSSQGKIFGFAGYYIYYMFDGVDRWLWVNYGMDNTYSAMQQSEASAGTSTNERLITAKVLSGTIDEKIDPLKNNILTVQNNVKLCYASLTSNLINAPDKTMTATGFVFQGIATKLLANTEYIFYFTIDSKAPMNLVGYTTGQSGRTIDIGILTAQQQIGVNAITFTPSVQVDTISLYINYQTEDVTYSGMIITPTITAINVIS